MSNDATEILRTLARAARGSAQNQADELGKRYFLGKAEGLEIAIDVLSSPAGFRLT